MLVNLPAGLFRSQKHLINARTGWQNWMSYLMFDQIPQYQYFNNIVAVIIDTFMKYEDNEIFDQYSPVEWMQLHQETKSKSLRGWDWTEVTLSVSPWKRFPEIWKKCKKKKKKCIHYKDQLIRSNTDKQSDQIWYSSQQKLQQSRHKYSTYTIRWKGANNKRDTA